MRSEEFDKRDKSSLVLLSDPTGDSVFGLGATLRCSLKSWTNQLVRELRQSNVEPLCSLCFCKSAKSKDKVVVSVIFRVGLRMARVDVCCRFPPELY